MNGNLSFFSFCTVAFAVPTQSVNLLSAVHVGPVLDRHVIWRVITALVKVLEIERIPWDEIFHVGWMRR